MVSEGVGKVLRFFHAAAVKRYKPANLKRYRLKPAKSPLESDPPAAGLPLPPFPSRPFFLFFFNFIFWLSPPSAGCGGAGRAGGGSRGVRRGALPARRPLRSARRCPEPGPAAARPPGPCVCLGGAVSHSSDLMQL